MSQEEMKIEFRKYVLEWLDYFCEMHNFQGESSDVDLFIWGLEPRGPINSNGYGFGIQEIMEKDGHIDLLNKLLEGKEKNS